MSPIYTGSGDNGTTSLAKGGRVPKDDPRVEAYGSIDEACSVIGAARAFVGTGIFAAELVTALKRKGFRTLLDDAADKVLAGLTTVEEVLEVATDY